LSPSFSPAEAAIHATGLDVATHEMPQLIRLVARRLPANRDAVRKALCDVRRKKWRARLNAIVSHSGRLWILPTDVQAAAGAIDDPEVSTDTLAATLDRIVADRLRQVGTTPEAALDSITADLADTAQVLPSPEQYAALAEAVAVAHGLAPEAVSRAAATSRPRWRCARCRRPSMSP
jgi:ATP-dependent RNA helicase SUPV3L1/SUV3